MSDQPTDQQCSRFRASLEEEGCYLCGEPEDTICDSCSEPICWGCQAEDSTDCVECSV